MNNQEFRPQSPSQGYRFSLHTKGETPEFPPDSLVEIDLTMAGDCHVYGLLADHGLTNSGGPEDHVITARDLLRLCEADLDAGRSRDPSDFRFWNGFGRRLFTVSELLESSGQDVYAMKSMIDGASKTLMDTLGRGKPDLNAVERPLRTGRDLVNRLARKIEVAAVAAIRERGNALFKPLLDNQLNVENHDVLCSGLHHAGLLNLDPATLEVAVTERFFYARAIRGRVRS